LSDCPYRHCAIAEVQVAGEFQSSRSIATLNRKVRIQLQAEGYRVCSGGVCAENAFFKIDRISSQDIAGATERDRA